MFDDTGENLCSAINIPIVERNRSYHFWFNRVDNVHICHASNEVSGAIENHVAHGRLLTTCDYSIRSHPNGSHLFHKQTSQRVIAHRRYENYFRGPSSELRNGNSMGCFSHIPANTTQMESNSSRGGRVSTTGAVSIGYRSRLCDDINGGRTYHYKFGRGLIWWERNWDAPLNEIWLTKLYSQDNNMLKSHGCYMLRLMLLD
jgi:hypothetical protein